MAADGDHDEMGDGWEREHGLDPGVDDAAEDLDGDGFDNRTEYLLGTDPASAARAGCGCHHGSGAPPWTAPVLLLVAFRRRSDRW